ncbi:hypothetical protein [Nitrosomonas sp.]|uniref:hypothetical protein n=1 Tax=Nitrosomonas sp. TaxID=42353 RepID=UPI0037CA0940
MKTEKFKADALHIEALAAFLLEVNLEDLAGDDGEYEFKLWNLFYNRYGVEVSDFAKLINALVPLIEIGKSPLTGRFYKGFADGDKRLLLVKMEIGDEK